MKIKKLLEDFNPENGILDYLSAVGIENPESYIHAGQNEIQNPALYLNIDIAAIRLYQAIEGRERVGILVDEDCDGMCSASMLYLFIKSQGLISKPIFHNIAKAHGIKNGGSENLIDEIKNLKLNLLIIPDASADRESCAELKQSGADVLIVDHHKYDFSANPCAIIVNCLQQDETNHVASGTLVTAKLIDRYCQRYGIEPPDNSDLIAMSIAADVMSLFDIENRAYLNLAMGGAANE